ncbi:MAG: hypothetical protein MZV64_17945 [Ignavibacteriales bacterium]|nr:hypothetical protein [Ignavibacteriales bacterium]
MGETMGDVSLENGFAEALIIYRRADDQGRVAEAYVRSAPRSSVPRSLRASRSWNATLTPTASPIMKRQPAAASTRNLAGHGCHRLLPAGGFQVQERHSLLDPDGDLRQRRRAQPDVEVLLHQGRAYRGLGYHRAKQCGLCSVTAFEVNPELNKNGNETGGLGGKRRGCNSYTHGLRGGAVLFQDQVRTHYEPWQAICQYGPDSKNPEKLAEEKEPLPKPVVVMVESHAVKKWSIHGK